MSYDFCILGAGIAGLSLADALVEQDYSVILLEKNDIASGASGTPGGLVNPATGRRGKKTWKAEPCYAAIHRNMEKVQEFSSCSFFKNNGLLRPALTTKMAQKMRQEFNQTAWPDGWCDWKTEQQIKELHPGINCVEGGLWLPVAFTVGVKAYLKAYALFLQEKAKVDIQTNVEANYHRQNGHWMIHTSKMESKSENLVFATGFATIGHPFWDFLPLEGVKGQVAAFKAPKSLLTFEHSISSMGYIARLDKTDEFIQGSTYEHHFDDLRTGRKAEQYLRSRTQKVLPELAQNAQLAKLWAGVRVNTPDRKPVVGAHPKIKNLHLFTGLGSKGLMFGKFLADHYAEHLKNGTSVFRQVSIQRFELTIRNS
jgi:glycine/D-amino acid oxidase-like deaminating enzyme